MPAEAERQGKGIPWSLSPLRASSTLLSVLIKDVCGTGAGRGNACEARKGFPDDMLGLKTIHYSMYMEETRREAAGVVQRRRNAPAEGRASKSIIADMQAAIWRARRDSEEDPTIVLQRTLHSIRTHQPTRNPPECYG